MKTKDLTEFRYNLLDWKRLARNLVFWCPRMKGRFCCFGGKIKAGSWIRRLRKFRRFHPAARCLLACCLLTTTFDQSFVSRLVVHIEENAGIGDFHELRRVAVFTDDRVGGIFGRERQ